MKRGWVWVVMVFFLVGLGACGVPKPSAVEGKLVDWNGRPLAGVKITASPVEPIKGHEHVEAVTQSDGKFRLAGLFPSSQYVLKLSSDKWTTETAVTLESAAHGETVVLREPVVIAQAYSTKKGGSLITDLATGATRFSVSADGVITDSNTGLEWIVGPDHNIDYQQAEQWVTAQQVAGGGWRLPTRKELETLYQKGVTKENLDPAFKITGDYVWAEPRDSSTAWGFTFIYGHGDWHKPHPSYMGGRVFGVRSPPR